MYKLVNLRTGKYHQAVKGTDLVLSDKISALYLKDDLEEETGDGYKLVPVETMSQFLGRKLLPRM